MSPFDSKPCDHFPELHELHYQLNLIQRWNVNQVALAAPRGGGKFGEMYANDWDLQDPSQNGKVVGHAKGLHIRSSRSDGGHHHTSFDIVFGEGSGLEGSTLQVMGPNMREWSIVGGTGKLTMARGIIYRKYNVIDGGARVEIQIHAFYTPMERRPNDGPCSGKNVWGW